MQDHVGARASCPHRGWHERGYLPHFDAGAVVQTVTFRLADSLPRELYEKISVVAVNPINRFFALEREIDRGLGSSLLAESYHAAAVENALNHFDGERYKLLAWVVMPNHVHVMIEQIAGHPLSRIVHSWKSFTANTINKQQNTSGRLWAPDYFDRFIRNEDHFTRARHYIEQNPVKAGLAARAEDWLYSSAAKQAKM